MLCVGGADHRDTRKSGTDPDEFLVKRGAGLVLKTPTNAGIETAVVTLTFAAVGWCRISPERSSRVLSLSSLSQPPPPEQVFITVA